MTQEVLNLLPVHSAVLKSGGVDDIELFDAHLCFAKNGCKWEVYAISPEATYPFVLFKDGHRILGFSNPESITNFFKGVQPG